MHLALILSDGHCVLEIQVAQALLSINFLRVVTHENCAQIDSLGGKNMSAIETALQACVDTNGQFKPTLQCAKVPQYVLHVCSQAVSYRKGSLLFFIVLCIFIC